MKKQSQKIILFITLLFSFHAWGDAKEILQQRLDKVQGFYAKFNQVVKTVDEQLVQEGAGELWVNRPNSFYWSLAEPDETAIISNGKNLWLYTPLLEQVTIMDLNQAVDNRLLLLITDSHNIVWNDYQVERKQNTFTLKPNNDEWQQFIITTLPTGMIADFSIIEADGQYSYYELSHQKLGKIDHSQFEFYIPNGVTIDDQRTQ